MKYFFLTREENMVAAMLNIADMASGDGGHLDRELERWLNAYEDDIRDIRELVRGSSIAFTRMYNEDPDQTEPGIPVTREALVASLRVILEKGDELAVLKKKLKDNETVYSNPKTSALDQELMAESRRFVAGHKLAKSSAKGNR